MPYLRANTACLMVVGPLLDAATMKVMQEAVAYNATGMDVDLVKMPSAGGTIVRTDLTLTTGGTQDWVALSNGYYSVEVTAVQVGSGGIAFLQGHVGTTVLVFESPHYDILDEDVYDAMVAGTESIPASVTDIAASAITASSIAANAIHTTALATGAITATSIASGAITAAKFATDAIAAAALATDAITEIAAGIMNTVYTSYSTTGTVGKWMQAVRALLGNKSTDNGATPSVTTFRNAGDTTDLGTMTWTESTKQRSEFTGW